MKKWLCAFVCVLLCAPGAIAQEAPALLEPVGVQLNAVEAEMGEISEITVYPASVVPYVQEFFFEQEGVIDEVHVIVGQQVKAGDPLITLDTEAEAERIEKLQRELEQLSVNAAYQVELDEIDLDMLEVELRMLLKAQPVDEDAVMLKKLDIEEQQLNMEKAARLCELETGRLQDELAALEREVIRNVLYAPFDGRVVVMTDRWQHGSYVSAFTPLLYLADDTQLFVESEYISTTTLGFADAVYARIGSRDYALTVTPLDEKKYLAQVLAGETLKSTFTFDEPDELLAPGQYAAICVESGYLQEALLVPTNCLYTAEKTRYLYVMEDGVRIRRDVKIGVSTDWMTQITEGLEEGELVYVKE